MVKQAAVVTENSLQGVVVFREDVSHSSCERPAELLHIYTNDGFQLGRIDRHYVPVETR